MKNSIKKGVFVTLALLFLVMGIAGVVLPILPTTPFLLAASFFFAKGSRRFNQWFLSTKLYERHLKSFVESRAVTFSNKVKILALASAMLLTTAFLVNNTYVGMTIILIMAFKYYYFIFHIETIEGDEEREAS
ncbi:MAG: DUF454 domain-containing protein [Clostridia bacterium]|nr:DUF454 domain-containing protein [Clostridia bacterium]